MVIPTNFSASEASSDKAVSNALTLELPAQAPQRVK